MLTQLALFTVASYARSFEGEASVGAETVVLSPNHELYDQANLHEAISPTAGVSGRFGVYALAFAGAEANFHLGTGVTLDTSSAALVHGFGLQFVGGPWLGNPRARFQPFVGVGAEYLGESSSALGSDTDAAWRVGLGAKYRYGDRAKVRVDLADSISSRFGPAPQPSHNFSFGVSFAMRLGPVPPPTTRELILELLSAYEDPATVADLQSVAPATELQAALVEIANDPDLPASRRGNAVTGLASLPPTPEVQAELETLFATPDPAMQGYMQRKAVWALAEAYPEAGKAAVAKALESPDLQIQWAAIHFLVEDAKSDPASDAVIEKDVPHVTFTMVGPDGKPVDGAVVHVAGPQGSEFDYGGESRARVIDPRFSGKEPWTISAEQGDCLRAKQEVVTGKEAAAVQIVMEAVRETPVAFDLRDDAGQPLKGAKVTFLSGPAYCSPEGTVELVPGQPLPVGGGTFEIRVEAEGYLPQVQTLTVVKGEPVQVASVMPRSDVKVQADRLQTGRINFDSGKATIAAASLLVLDDLAAAIISGKFHPIHIEGHTDNQGNPVQNLTLSQQRADAVRTYLVRKGVPVDWLTAQGFGDTRPVVGNETADGQKTNRRVEFVFDEEVIP